MKYSFVLPAYKARFFKEALDSILSQTYKDFELIIVNDASPEDLGSIVKSYDDPRIRYYVNEQNIGGKDLVAQWNHCLEYAIGEYIILASDDDVYHVEYLEKMDKLVCQYPAVNVFRPRIKWINYDGCTINIEPKIKELMSQIDFIYLYSKGSISRGIQFYLFKKRALLNIKGFINFPLAWFSDDATVMKLSRDKIISTNEILFSFRDSGLNISSTINNKEMLLHKLYAAELFYSWLVDELKYVICNNKEDSCKKMVVYSTSYMRRNDHMIGLIKHSVYNRNVIESWRILRKIKSLKSIDRLKILYRSFIK